ncbi:hypothetical protein SVI_0512 [Shewanella violacea DSS12]|uniref:Uncharacterized protein n=1 Tax=Shewanella violacea (strain JCM 10179 / CIP 106290 / LMG 19151 / DSS12) TaxID=637905 RepID=D4ZFN4_SHEVD|nr:hypothetical protein SVI_0512 [Shewanella violacea DSS12]
MTVRNAALEQKGLNHLHKSLTECVLNMRLKRILWV